MVVRTGKFPFGYFMLALLLGVISAGGYVAYGQIVGGHLPPTIDEAVVVEPQSLPLPPPDLGPPVDPRFVPGPTGPSPNNPDWRLDDAAGNAGPDSPPSAYEEFKSAMTEHPYVERVFRARYAQELATSPEYARYGLVEFRKHYRDVIPQITPTDQLPIYGCLVVKELERVMDGLFGDPLRKAQVDRDVRAALQAARGYDRDVN
jgi:hypothetical protein